jgi:hypothetical protein
MLTAAIVGSYIAIRAMSVANILTIFTALATNYFERGSGKMQSLAVDWVYIKLMVAPTPAPVKATAWACVPTRAQLSAQMQAPV